jgi:3-oxoacid CoA-transferase subunit B
LDHCTLPLTGANCIRRVLTDLAYLEIENGAFVLKERAPGVSVEEIVSKTAGRLIVPDVSPRCVFNEERTDAGRGNCRSNPHTHR